MAKGKQEPNYFAGDVHDTAILAEAGVIVSIENDRPAGRRMAPFTTAAQPATSPSVVIPDSSLYPSVGGDIFAWGEGNDFPQRLIELYNRDPLIPSSLGRVSSYIQGGGIVAVENDMAEEAGEPLRPILSNTPIGREINAFLRCPQFWRYLREMATDVAWFFNGWPEMLISKDRKKIVQLHPLNAEEVRWCRMTPEGELPHIFLNANWPRANSGLPSTKQITALDPYRWDAVDWLREQDSLYNCVYPIAHATPGNRFYSLPHHYSIVESGWLDVHLYVPEYKKFLLKNQMTIKYHWKVDVEYWGKTYGEKYTKGSPEQKRAIKKKWLEAMNKSLTDVTKTGNSIITDVTWDPVNKLFKDHITITPIADFIKDGKYLADNVEASSMIIYAMGLDPATIGLMGGEKNGERSGGSDKREAHLIGLQATKPLRDSVCEPLHFVAQFNGWKNVFPDIGFRSRDTVLTTLDTGAGKKDILTP